MHILAHVRRSLPGYAGRRPLWSFYFQKYIFARLKGYIFHFNTPQVNLISDWALKLALDKALYNGKMGFEMALKRYEIHSKP